MRSEGRAVKEGCQALKFVKARAGTIGRMRELEVMKDGLKEAGEQIGASEAMQGLYARHQTEMYKPDPVVNVSILKPPSVSWLAIQSPSSFFFSLRVRYRRTTLGISTCMFLQCFLWEPHTFPVSFISYTLMRKNKWKFSIRIVSDNLSTVKGAAKIARKLGLDYAEAVVREQYPLNNLLS